MIDTTEGIHATTHPKGTGWVTMANGVVLSSHRNKPNAIAKGRRLAKKHGEQLVLHRKDGRVVETRSYEVTPI
jgi:hypothetical protein